VISSTRIVDVRYVREGDGWRVHRADTGKVLGHVQGLGQEWHAKASRLAFLGDGAAGGEPLGDWVPPALYAPLRASEGHDYLPGVHRTRRLAVAALQTYLHEQHAPAMGWPAHPDVRKAS
jgi:hypothetical protein